MKANIKDSYKRIKRALIQSRRTGKSVSIETTLAADIEPITRNQSQTILETTATGEGKTILFAPLDSHGHINSLEAIANHLRSLDFRTIFLFIEPIENTLESKGHEVYDSTSPELTRSAPASDAQDKWNAVINACHEMWSTGSILENFEDENKKGFGIMIEDIKRYNSNIAAKLELIKPNCIVVDHYFGIPAIFKYIQDNQIPWIRVASQSPLGLHAPSPLPPHYLALPTNWDPNNEEQAKLVEVAQRCRREIFDDYNAYFTSFGLPDLPRDSLSKIPVSPHLNLYMYPKELDYTDIHPLDGWTHCESILRTSSPKPFVLPDKLRNKPGKLIYLSLGSLASADVLLMKRMIEMLADCPHRFIVAKGPFADQYELPDNMWGEKFVDQLSVLQAVDLIVTHGGNNTLVESFFFGVGGLVVCPLFSDQFDNAVRVEEMKLGVNLRPFFCTKEQLQSSIERILADDTIRQRMKAASERMQRPEVRDKAIFEVTSMLKRHNLL